MSHDKVLSATELLDSTEDLWCFDVSTQACSLISMVSGVLYYVVANRVSVGGNAIAYVRPSVRLSVCFHSMFGID